jgi:hypothetical protein
VTVLAVTAIDIRILNRMSWGKQMGPLRKFMLINLLNCPIYLYYYYSLTRGYLQLQKHLVKKYLISGDELIYKPR